MSKQTEKQAKKLSKKETKAKKGGARCKAGYSAVSTASGVIVCRHKWGDQYKL